MVRALRPHIGARLPLPDGRFLGVRSARVDGPTLAAAGGRVRTDGDRLLLDCRGGALELVEIQPPGGRPMAAGAWLRGRPDPALTDFWLDPRLPDRPLDELVALAVEEWDCARGVGAVPGGARLPRHARRAGGAAAARGRRRPARPQRRRVRGRPARRAAAHAARRVRDAARGDGGARARPGRPGRDRRGVRAPRRALGHRAAARAEAPRRLRRCATPSRPRSPAVAIRGPRRRSSSSPPTPTRGSATGRPSRWAPSRPRTRRRCATRSPRGSTTRIPRRASRPCTASRCAGTCVPSSPRSRSSRRASRAARAGRATRCAESAIRLAALTGDPRFSPYLPPLDGVWAGTALQRELARAHERCAGGG